MSYQLNNSDSHSNLFSIGLCTCILGMSIFSWSFYKSHSFRRNLIETGFNTYDYLYDKFHKTWYDDKIRITDITKKDINIKLFSEQLGVDKDNLSVYIYNRFGFSFDDLVNKHRVAYFTELIKNPKYNNLTIDALAKEVGFASRSAFYKPFKKFHGGNPSDLIDMYS